jgi:hypothetical protein
MSHRFSFGLPAAMLAMVCCPQLRAADTQPSPPAPNQNLAWVLDRSLVQELGVRDAAVPAQQLKGRLILRLDEQLNNATAAVVPATQPSTLQGYVTIDLQQSDQIDKNGVLTLQTTQPHVLVKNELGLQATLDQDAQIRRDLFGDRLAFYYSRLEASHEEAYLGIGVEAPAAALRSQLSLPDGAGLLVNFVAPDGPSHSNIELHDVLQKFDDQILINGEQLVTLVRMHKPGDTIKLTLLRHASPVTEQITLGKRPAADPRQTESGAAPDELTGLPFVGQLYRYGPRPITFNDGELTATLDGGNLLAVDPATGKTLFQGPITTEQQWKQVPQPVRNKLDAWRSLIEIHQPAEKK